MFIFLFRPWILTFLTQNAKVEFICMQKAKLSTAILSSTPLYDVTASSFEMIILPNLNPPPDDCYSENLLYYPPECFYLVRRCVLSWDNLPS